MRTQRGFTLLEILVALLVLALGLLGAGAMQLAAARARHESALLTAATQLASGMLDRMRANPHAVADIYLSLDYDARREPSPAAPALCWGGGCDGAALARADLYELKRQVAAQFPGGRARICRDAGMWGGAGLRWSCNGGAGAPVVVKIGWRGKHPDGSPARDAAGEYAPGVALAMAGGAP